jgi:NADPH:quinone reductase-like Zn-dependent oxidoreductase
MKAVIYEKYGPPEVLKIKDVIAPEVKEDSVIIKIKYTTVTTADTLMRKADSFVSKLFLGLLRPRKRILGTEFSGIVEKVGNKVTLISIGDCVYGFTGFSLGAYAEYCILKEKASFVKIPDNMSLQDAVCLGDGATTAVYFLHSQAHLKQNDEILIIGASGAIGTYAVQIAKHYGAKVTGVCSTKNVELVKQLGADEIVDYTKEDYYNRSAIYDVVFDCIGNTSFDECKKILKENGKYITTRGGLRGYLEMMIMNRFRSKMVIAGMSINKMEELNILNKIWIENKISTIIDKEYSMEQVVEAHRYVETSHKKGNVVIKVC